MNAIRRRKAKLWATHPALTQQGRFLAVLLIIFNLTIVTVSYAGENWVVREDGVGPAKIGMTLSQLNEAIHENFTMPKDKEDQGCFYVEPSKHPHIGFMIEDGRLARVDARGVYTSTHIQVGDSETSAIRAYEHKLKVDPNPYVPRNIGHYLTARSSSGKYGIRFEAEKGKIQLYYAGRYDAVQYVEDYE